MRKTIAIDGKVSNPAIQLPDDWTGAEGDWQKPIDAILYDEVIGASEGDLYDGSTLTKQSPNSDVSYAEFEQRFTDIEAEALLSHIKTVPSLERAVNRATARNRVSLTSVNTVGFMGALVAAGVITESRKIEILEP